MILPTKSLGAVSFRHISSLRRGFFHMKTNTESRAFLSRGGATNRTSSSSSSNEHQNDTGRYRVFLGVGSNLGDRFQHITQALKMLCDDPLCDESSSSSSASTELIRTSFLHNTAAMYVTNQPDFLNGAVEIQTNLAPHSLLSRLKQIEADLGRNFSEITNGPRPIDLDILFYDDDESQDGNDNLDPDRLFSPMTVDAPNLTIPHRRIQEREFVLAPLLEIAGSDYMHPVIKDTLGGLFQRLQKMNSNDDPAIRVLPLPRGRFLYFNETIIMGILNVTPDSFSDGGKWNTSVSTAVERALEMEREGASIIDIGGESTRPGAKEIPVDQQIDRTVPIIQQIRKVSDIPISIDTRHAAVAQAAVEAGADIVNDVSGGNFDPMMFPTVAKLGVPVIMMHMRGTPETMQDMTIYDDLVTEVVEALRERSAAAEKAGIPKWLQIADPGIGFAKDIDGNLSLLKHTARIRVELGDLPILLGTSRKGFLGKLTGETNPENRDYGTLASCVAALCLGSDSHTGCNILRVHNVRGARHGALVMDAILKTS